MQTTPHRFKAPGEHEVAATETFEAARLTAMNLHLSLLTLTPDRPELQERGNLWPWLFSDQRDRDDDTEREG